MKDLEQFLFGFEAGRIEIIKATAAPQPAVVDPASLPPAVPTSMRRYRGSAAERRPAELRCTGELVGKVKEGRVWRWVTRA